MRSNGAGPFSFLTSRTTYRKPWKLAGARALTSGLCRRRVGVRSRQWSRGYRTVVVATKTARVGVVDVDGARPAARHGGVYRGPWKKVWCA
jgi:hypothetical protein